MSCYSSHCYPTKNYKLSMELYHKLHPEGEAPEIKDIREEKLNIVDGKEEKEDEST